MTGRIMRTLTTLIVPSPLRVFEIKAQLISERFAVENHAFFSLPSRFFGPLVDPRYAGS